MAKQPFPLDHGWSWVIVCGCFLVSFFIMGIGKSSGILLVVFQSRFHVSMSSASMTLGVASLAFALTSPVCIILGQTFTERHLMMVGGFIGFAGIALSSLLYSMEYVVATFGVCFGIGNAAIYGNCLVLLGYYFNKRRSLANGLALAGASIGQFAMPPVIEFLLETFGLQGCLLLVSGLYFNTVVASSLFRPRSFWAEPRHVSRQQHATVQGGADGQQKRDDHDRVTANGHLTDHTTLNGTERPSANLPGGCAVVKDHPGANGDLSRGGDVVARRQSLCNTGEEAEASSEREEGRSSPVSPSVSPSCSEAGLALHAGKEESEEKAEASSKHEEECSPRTPLVASSPGTQEGEEEERESSSSKVLRCREFTTSSGSLRARTVSMHSSSVVLETYGLEMETEDWTGEEGGGDGGKAEKGGNSPGFCKTLMAAMFDFSIMRSYVAVLVIVSSVLAMIGYSSFIMFLPPAVMMRGVNKYDKALLVSICGIGDLVGRLFTAVTGDREFIRRYKLQACAILVLAFNIAMMMFADRFAWMAVHCLLYGLCGGVYVSLAVVVIIDMVGLKNMPRILGVMMLVQGTVISVFQPLLGALYDATGSFQFVIGICALTTLLGGFLLLSYPLVVKLERTRPERFRLLPQNT